MEILDCILIVILLAVSVCMCATNDFKSDIGFVKLIFFGITALLCIIYILNNSTKLRDKDVFVGKAEYVETIHISKGDTIKTYHIQPKD